MAVDSSVMDDMDGMAFDGWCSITSQDFCPSLSKTGGQHRMKTWDIHPSSEYIDDTKKCQLCDATCYKCNGPDENQCISCVSTRYFDSGSCGISCSKGKFPLNGQCHLCHHTCKECSGGEPQNCTACGEDKFKNIRYLFQGECREACPVGYYPFGNSCHHCSENCEVCTGANKCIKCSLNYFPSNGNCVKLECGEGEVEDPEYEDCVPCEEGCQKCTLQDPRNCSSCMQDFYMFKSRCYKNCPAKTYTVEESMECKECHETCLSCDENQCYWCEDGLFLSDNTCVSECEEGFYGNEDNQECEPCHHSCKTCGGPLPEDCKSCEITKKLLNGKCQMGKVCKDGEFSSDDGSGCKKCDQSCLTCTISSSNCTSCRQGFFLTNELICVPVCAKKTFANARSGKCEDCSEGCEQCSDKNSCQKCLRGKMQLYLHNGKCVRQCPRGYVEDESNCISCSSNCKTCENSRTNCLACNEPYVLYQNTCSITCPEGHFEEGGICHRCPLGCLKCNKDGICTECEEYFYMHQDKCVEECPTPFFVDSKSASCQPCHPDCSICSGPNPNDCEKCADPESVLFKGECFSHCPAGSFYNMETEDCQDCDKTCQTCNGPYSTNCIKCQDGMVKNEHSHCVSHWDCPLSSYQDQNGNCRKCHRSCHLCTGPTQHECLSCIEDYFLLNKSCITQCPRGFHSDPDRRHCVPCHGSCETCKGKYSSQCLTCKEELFKQGGECVKECKPGFYANISSGSCEVCDSSCKDCTGSEHVDCITCQNNFYLLEYQKRCYHTCPEGYYKNNVDMTCVRCHPTCQTCNAKGALACSACYDGFTFVQGICESKCLAGEYAAVEEPELLCVQCHESCIECKGDGPNNCTVCPPSTLISLEEHRCLHCCASDVQELEDCCNCSETQEECLVRPRIILQHAEYAGKPALFITSAIFLILGTGAAIFLFLTSRSKKQQKVKSGYEKLTNSEKSYESTKPSSAYRGDHVIEYHDPEKEEEDDDDDEDDIVYMGQDGTVYRKFKYGLLDEDDDDELEYDDESYSFR